MIAEAGPEAIPDRAVGPGLADPDLHRRKAGAARVPIATTGARGLVLLALAADPLPKRMATIIEIRLKEESLMICLLILQKIEDA